MPRGFLPNADAALLAWSANFAQKLSAGYAGYGVSPAQAEAFAAAQAAFAEAMAVAARPATRTVISVAEKNVRRDAVRAAARRLSSIIQGQSGVDDAQRLALGLSVRAAPTRIGPPTGRPAIAVVGVSGRTVTLRLEEAAEAAPGRGRPAGCCGAAIWSFVGERPPEDLRGWHFVGHTSRVRLDATFDADVPGGARVWFTGRWLSPRLEAGPLADPVATHIAGGMQSATATLRAA